MMTSAMEKNILISFYAMSQRVPRVISKVNRNELSALAEKLGLDCIVSPKNIIADILVRYARALNETVGSKVETLYSLMDGEAEALEFTVMSDFEFTEVPLKMMKLKPDVLIAGIIRGRHSIIPGGDDVIKSRIGLANNCRAIDKGEDVFDVFKSEASDVDAIICDECQFFTPEQIDGFRRIVDEYDLPVLCFGLRTDFLTHSFPGSARLFEIADSISEIKTICECGSKATVNARITADGKVVTKGRQVMLGGNDRYVAMCHRCWKNRIAKENNQ